MAMVLRLEIVTGAHRKSLNYYNSQHRDGFLQPFVGRTKNTFPTFYEPDEYVYRA